MGNYDFDQEFGNSIPMMNDVRDVFDEVVEPEKDSGIRITPFWTNRLLYLMAVSESILHPEVGKETTELALESLEANAKDVTFAVKGLYNDIIGNEFNDMLDKHNILLMKYTQNARNKKDNTQIVEKMDVNRQEFTSYFGSIAPSADMSKFERLWSDYVGYFKDMVTFMVAGESPKSMWNYLQLVDANYELAKYLCEALRSRAPAKGKKEKNPFSWLDEEIRSEKKNLLGLK